MTSTYLPFFFPLPVFPFRACGAPIKSSIELAWLKDVPGRDPGPDLDPGGVKPETPDETDRGIRCGLPVSGGGTPKDDNAGLVDRDGAISEGGPRPNSDDVTKVGTDPDIGGTLVDNCGTDIGGGALPALTDLLGGAEPLGGGGVALGPALALLGSFLLTHFFKSVS